MILYPPEQNDENHVNLYKNSQSNCPGLETAAFLMVSYNELAGI